MDVNTHQGDYNILALDYGNVRVGAAMAHSIARIPSPLGTYVADETLLGELAAVVATNNIQQIVVGMPYAPRGGDTDQTKIVRDFVAELKQQFSIPIVTVDESLSSVEAERLLGNKPVEKGMIDAYAAAIILQRYFDETMGTV